MGVGEGRSRGISPVVGVALLVVIVTALAGVSTYVFLGLSEEREPQPDVALELEVADDGVTHRIVHEGGERLDGDKVRLRGAADPEALSGTELTATDTAAFYPDTQEIQVVYTGEFGTTYLIDTFEAESTVPAPDEGCDWVDSQTNGGTDDISISNRVVNCDVETDGAITIENNGVVIGDVESNDGDVDITNGEVYGYAAAGGDLTVTDGSITDEASTTTTGDDHRRRRSTLPRSMSENETTTSLARRRVLQGVAGAACASALCTVAVRSRWRPSSERGRGSSGVR